MHNTSNQHAFNYSDSEASPRQYEEGNEEMIAADILNRKRSSRF